MLSLYLNKTNAIDLQKKKKERKRKRKKRNWLVNLGETTVRNIRRRGTKS